jgi:hypothetical protein
MASLMARLSGKALNQSMLVWKQVLVHTFPRISPCTVARRSLTRRGMQWHKKQATVRKTRNALHVRFRLRWRPLAFFRVRSE